VDRNNEDPSVLGLVRIGGGESPGAVALAMRFLAGDKILRDRNLHEREGGVEQANVERLPLARHVPAMQGGERADRGMQRRDAIYDRRAASHGSAVAVVGT